MVAEKGASGDFDYLWEESDGSDGVSVVDDKADGENEYESLPDHDYLLAQDEPRDRDGFDAFDENTWGEIFTSASTTPWYRTRQAQTLLLASGVALSAIVISVVLLAFRGPSSDSKPSSVQATTPPATTALATMTSQAPPPPPPPPGPPPPPEPSPVQRAPAAVERPPVQQQRPTKAPEINVTRLPMSVAPQQRHPRN